MAVVAVSDLALAFISVAGIVLSTECWYESNKLDMPNNIGLISMGHWYLGVTYPLTLRRQLLFKCLIWVIEWV